MAADASPKYRPSDLLPATTAAALSLPHDGLPFWQYMLAGSAAGVVEHTSMFPLDTLKTRMQALSPPCLPLLSLRSALLSSSSSYSNGFGFYLLRPLYRGVSAMALGAAPAHAAYFSVYEASKDLLSGGRPNDGGPLVHASSGVAATVASDAVFTPMDTVKQRLQLERSPYRGVTDCVRRVVAEEGVRALFASYRTTVLMNAPFTAVHFAAYEAAKRGLAGASPEGGDNAKNDDDGLAVHATAGAAAGALAAAVTTPLDVVKTQLQCQGVCGCHRFPNSSIRGVIGTIVKRDGYMGLVRGWKPRMLFHAPAAAICWSTYEAAKSFFQEFNHRTQQAS